MRNVDSPNQYEPQNERQFRRTVAEALARCFKRDEDLVLKNARIVARSPDGSWWVLGVGDTGATTWTRL